MRLRGILPVAAVAAVALLVPATAASGARRAAPTSAGRAAPAAARDQAAAPAPVPGRPQPGGVVAWRPEGRQVLGRPVVYRSSFGGVELAWLDMSMLRPVFVPGTGDPGGPWSWGGQVAPEARSALVAAFNGGFKSGDTRGGWYSDGRTLKSLVPGEASVVIYRDGHATVGEWGRDVDLTLDVVAVRQNLGILVDGGRPVPGAASPGLWGGSVAGVATARSGLGVDANGNLISAQARVSPQGLADALVAAGAVRGMQLDINPDWINFQLYEQNADGSVRGQRVMGTGGPGGSYLSPYARDFFAMVIKPTVAAGGTGTIGAAPVTLTAKVRSRR